ncbi:DUF1573 domain-containing protein [Pedobacter deserti]|uniref:DUF1573 domain-containing protein n=1 Tax=Pedobacter deserti TaxID=2817382 RepID=UPI00210B0D2A|nr:DUF1573 domain-containing protein [Pedobacter sp. SYSU D00382]
MKKILFALFVAAALTSCQSKTEQTNESASSPADTSSLKQDGPVMKFTTETYNFGKIKKGESVSYSFTFKNMGQVPLIITDAVTTCGCTVPEVPKEPVKPGDEGKLNVVFNSAGKPVGMTDRVVTVMSNALNSSVQLHIVGEITE